MENIDILKLTLWLNFIALALTVIIMYLIARNFTEKLIFKHEYTPNELDYYALQKKIKYDLKLIAWFTIPLYFIIGVCFIYALPYIIKLFPE